MLQLQTFSFYFKTENDIHDPTLRVSYDDIQRTFTNVGIPQAACIAKFY